MTDKGGIMFVGDIVEANGKTWRENNLSVKHGIPLGTKLIISVPVEGTITCYVVEHSRDCDGSPLYRISPFRTTDDGTPLWDHVEELRQEFTRTGVQRLTQSYYIDGFYGEDTLLSHIVDET